jgi:TolB-like protein
MAFDLLAYLVAHRGRVVGKDELIQEIWHGRAVSDAALTTRVNAVRRAVGDDGKAQRLIRTFSRKGVRFVGDALEVAATRVVLHRTNIAANGRTSVPGVGERAAVVVVPFTALGSDPEEQWFADGLVENGVVALGRFRWFSVVAPAMGRVPAHHPLNVKRIGWESGAGYVVLGTVCRRGEQLRITAHLVETSRGSHLWSDQFDGSLADGFELHDQIAARIAGSIEAPLRIAEAARSDASQDRNLTPYELHVRAHPIFSTAKRASRDRSICLNGPSRSTPIMRPPWRTPPFASK